MRIATVTLMMVTMRQDEHDNDSDDDDDDDDDDDTAKQPRYITMSVQILSPRYRPMRLRVHNRVTLHRL